MKLTLTLAQVATTQSGQVYFCKFIFFKRTINLSESIHVETEEICDYAFVLIATVVKDKCHN